jgi:hypothetical protein
MSLPSSGIISGSQIAAALSVASTNISLRGMGNTASLSSGEGEISYSDFYGYSPAVNYQEYYYYDVGQKFNSFACSYDTNAQFYFSSSTNPTASFPQIGDSIYDYDIPVDASPIILSAGWYGVAGDTNIASTQAIQFNGSTNVIVGFSLC